MVTASVATGGRMDLHEGTARNRALAAEYTFPFVQYGLPPAPAARPYVGRQRSRMARNHAAARARAAAFLLANSEFLVPAPRPLPAPDAVAARCPFH